MRIKSLLLSMVVLSFTTACQTSAKSKVENLDKVQVGMDKAQVLEVTGFGPRTSDRKNGQDRWFFEVFPDRNESVTHQREIRFQDGKVVYNGAPQKPSVTAEEQDRLN